ncbi:hypothetical protein PTTG_27385 [Puccinia triticina 1-1 BBBD Race 1]|uniref:Uncharacterized protein n=1 Tax=Puccinia triticina (isolate 1-1 / race 1 (BBBD)) TaxID=630390 RepID=A0A180GKP1_PUCT1|nr:hypothetical protein PTTG_27385 [Puccinia triticina 1-1 BBBD Race 1]
MAAPSPEELATLAANSESLCRSGKSFPQLLAAVRADRARGIPGEPAGRLPATSSPVPPTAVESPPPTVIESPPPSNPYISPPPPNPLRQLGSLNQSHPAIGTIQNSFSMDSRECSLSPSDYGEWLWDRSSTRAGLRPRQILPSPQSQLLLEKVEALVMDAFTGAAERRIEVSDCLEIFVIEAGKGVRVIRNELKTN